jgi:hypothetical protein
MSPRRNRPRVALPSAAEFEWRPCGSPRRARQELMTEKGMLIRGERFGSHVYQASVPKEQRQQQIAGDLLKRAFGGSARKPGDARAGGTTGLARRTREEIGGAPRLDAGPLPPAGLADCGSDAAARRAMARTSSSNARYLLAPPSCRAGRATLLASGEPGSDSSFVMKFRRPKAHPNGLFQVALQKLHGSPVGGDPASPQQKIVDLAR